MVWLPEKKTDSYVGRYNLNGTRNQENPPTVRYEAVMKSDDGVKEWTALIVSYNEKNHWRHEAYY